MKLEEIRFYQREITALKRCIDNAERWASSRIWDESDHKAHELSRKTVAKIEALVLLAELSEDTDGLLNQ